MADGLPAQTISSVVEDRNGASGLQPLAESRELTRIHFPFKLTTQSTGLWVAPMLVMPHLSTLEADSILEPQRASQFFTLMI